MPKAPLTLQQAADELGVHYMTVYRYVRTGKLPATRVGGGWRIDPSDLARLKPPGPGRPRKPASRVAVTKQLEARLVAGDEPGAWGVLEAALASDHSPSQVLLQLVAPALESIGERWHRGELNVADEHRGTAVAVRLISRIGARFARRGPKSGTVIITTPPAELHSTPVAIAADLLRWAGFNVIELGADTPADALVHAVAGAPDLLAVAMACTTRASTTAARRVVAHLRGAAPGTTVLLGGAAISSADHARRLGADGFTGRRGDDLVRVIEGLAAAR
jgi:MerR family transcriptional regulator, light-induced transcriptional regulator